MTRARVRAVAVDAGSVLHAQVPGADFVHACRAAVPRAGRSALQAYKDMAAAVPGWFDGLMALRNGGMQLLGMKNLGSLRALQSAADPVPGQRLGIFTVQQCTAEAIVLEDDDRHLRVQLALQWRGDLLDVATVVHTHNAFGRVYMLPVAPVHLCTVGSCRICCSGRCVDTCDGWHWLQPSAWSWHQRHYLLPDRMPLGIKVIAHLQLPHIRACIGTRTTGAHGRGQAGNGDGSVALAATILAGRKYHQPKAGQHTPGTAHGKALAAVTGLPLSSRRGEFCVGAAYWCVSPMRRSM